MTKDLKVLEVRIWGRQVGAVAPLKGKPGFYEFEYASDFARTGMELSPLYMPLASKQGKTRRRYSFPSLNTETYQGLPGLLADALPDRFGNALINEYLSRRGIRAEDITPLQRMAYIGRRAMGALEFEPAASELRGSTAETPLNMASLVEDARRALHGKFSDVAQDILDIGSSAGGARAKAVIGWNPNTNEVVSGQFDLAEGYEHWLLKFDIGLDGTLGYTAGYGRIEYAYHLMADAAGVSMNACRLHEESGRAHFMTKRFDRQGNRKLHMQTLCGLAHLDFNLPYVHGYEQYLRTVLELNLGADALEQAWLRCVFNVVAMNCDDHTKNLAFTFDESGGWQLAPAYDVCFSHNPGPDKWTRQHQMLVGGKAWKITHEDLLALANQFDIKRPKAVLQKVVDAIARWPEFAECAGVSSAEIVRIGALHVK
jgi:serine/threonine-protein kinase HipA